MPVQFYLGQRLSFGGALCSVRYIGPVEGSQASSDWLGVEWDDSLRGKHSGEHQGKRYFHCLSSSSTAASFVRSTRHSDTPRSFIAALRWKYGADLESSTKKGSLGALLDQAKATSIIFSGKTVEEVGFEKVNQRLGLFQELRTVLLDGLCLDNANRNGQDVEIAQDEIGATCPNIVQLDLSRNLLPDWESVAAICQPLKKLKILKVNGNRFHSCNRLRKPGDSPFGEVQELYIEECLLNWEQAFSFVDKTDFPNLRLLSLSGNELVGPMTPLRSSLPSLRELKLDFNRFRNLAELTQLNTCFPNLATLSLRGNQISTVTCVSASTRDNFPTISSLSLSHNNIFTWSFVDDLNLAMPALRALQISSNPLFENDSKLDPQALSPPSSMVSTLTVLAQHESTLEAYSMAVLARLGNITSLNYSHITPQERLNGELYYLAEVDKELAETSFDLVDRAHPRYLELCRKYDRDPVTRSSVKADKGVSPLSSLPERFVNIRFYWSSQDKEGLKEYHKVVPKSIDIYRLKGLVMRAFRLRPLSFRLMYESGFEEMLPAQQELSNEDWDRISTSVNAQFDTKSLRMSSNQNTPLQSERKETELVNSTRELGFFLENDMQNINVRVEEQ